MTAWAGATGAWPPYWVPPQQILIRPMRDSTTASWGVATWECRESPKGDFAIFIGRPTPHLLILLS